MRWTWLFIIPPIIIFALIVVAFCRYFKRSKDRNMKKVAVLAHTRTVKMLPAYRRAILRYRILLALAAVSFLASIFSFTAVAARPISSELRASERKNRDIILCLDTSWSMSTYQKNILKYFKEMSSFLKGERIGITIFDGVVANIVPLSDDYDAVIDAIDILFSNFQQYGSAVSKDGLVSRIGDGVVGCVNSFDKLEDSERSKSIILATDNQSSNEETIDISQAARYAMRYGVTIYGIAPHYRESIDETRFMNAVSKTGGTFHTIDNTSLNEETAKEIVQKIFAQENAKFIGAPEIIYIDQPIVYLFISCISFATFIIAIWRLRL